MTRQQTPRGPLARLGLILTTMTALIICLPGVASASTHLSEVAQHAIAESRREGAIAVLVLAIFFTLSASLRRSEVPSAE